MMRWFQLGFQDGMSPFMWELIEFHDYVMVILFWVLVLVGGVLASLVSSGLSTRGMLEHQLVEGVWTIIPAVILIFLALPSLHLLYLSDELFQPLLTVKAVGHQWYWSYEYSDFEDLGFDSYMVGEDNLKEGDYRLLEVDNRVVLPYGVEVRVLATSADVIHAWTVPSLGVKSDAVPGRLNQMSLFMKTPGVFYGQCSEICGANHSFMPIVLESVSWTDFLSWVKS